MRGNKVELDSTARFLTRKLEKIGENDSARKENNRARHAKRQLFLQPRETLSLCSKNAPRAII
jgi:hypothetical protein